MRAETQNNVDAIAKSLKLLAQRMDWETAPHRLEEFDAMIEAPDLWNDPAKAQKLMRDRQALMDAVSAYKQIIDAARSGKPHPNFVRGGLKDGFVKTSAYGPTVSEAARKNADAVKAKMIAGSFDIFAGEMKDNTGKVVIPKGKTYKQTDVELEGMNYLIEGVMGKI